MKTAELACELNELKIEHVAIDSLRPDPANPRRIGERELESLTRSLQQFGFVQPVLVRKSDNVVIGGHQRLVAARRLGWKTVPVVFLDLSPEQARLLNLALNKISGQWDTELLARMLADLKPIEDIDLSLSGFSEEELGKLLKSLDARDKRSRVETFDLQAAWEEAQRAPGVTRGDVWRLGEPMPLFPEWGNGYDVLPDDQAERVERLKKERLDAQEAVSRSPTSPILEFLEEKLGRPVTERQERWDGAMAALRESLREGIPWCWQELRAAEAVLDEVAQELGEDPLLPPVRQVLAKTRQDLVELHPLLGFVDVEVELPEPDEERVEFLRQRWLREDT